MLISFGGNCEHSGVMPFSHSTWPYANPSKWPQSHPPVKLDSVLCTDQENFSASESPICNANRACLSKAFDIFWTGWHILGVVLFLVIYLNKNRKRYIKKQQRKSYCTIYSTWWKSTAVLGASLRGSVTTTKPLKLKHYLACFNQKPCGLFGCSLPSLLWLTSSVLSGK